MWETIIGIVINLLEKFGWVWWQSRKKREAENAQNDVSAMSADDISRRLHNDWTKPGS